MGLIETSEKSKKHLWFYPLLFGLLGAFLGLITRFLFASPIIELPLKHLIHSHSHVMLLGFLFNSLLVFLWQRFTEGIDKTSYRIYIALQVCVAGMLFTFIAQGYALFSITFSTLHLWLSYMFVVRLWKRLKGEKQLLTLIKTGVVFHFISSIGPYCLGPLMALEMQASPWYQQAIFFYLHFQYFGAFLTWLLAIFFQKYSIRFNNTSVALISISIIGLYTHSLNYSFDHWLINTIGGISSALLCISFLSFWKQIHLKNKGFLYIYYTLLLIGVCNILGSFSFVAEILITEHFVLIAWLHFLFLGLYTPFIWLQLPIKISRLFWGFYGLVVILSETILLIPSIAFKVTQIPVMWLLFIAYTTVFICFAYVHLRAITTKRLTS